MCSPTCIDFVTRALTRDEVAGKRVIEVGSRNVNGSARRFIESLRPAEYVGVDIEAAPEVDVICDIEKLCEKFDAETFDLVVTTEVLEHVRDWRLAVFNLKRMCRPGGVVIVTTRSYGFAYHGYPFDYWRYELSDMRRLFEDCAVETLETDTRDAGVFMKARKPLSFQELQLEGHSLYSIVLDRRAKNISDADLRPGKLFRVRLRERMRRALRSLKRTFVPSARREYREAIRRWGSL
jgi:SAM-dependent methyltransferase